MSLEQIQQKYRLQDHRLSFSKAKLKAVSRTSALLSGFSMIALVEISLDDHKQMDTLIPLIIIYSTLTCLVIGVHLLVLMISMCLFPLLEVDGLIGSNEHETIHMYVEFAWLLSSGFGIVLFLLDMIIVCWMKFFFITRRAAVAATIVIFPILILICIFSLHFYRRLAILKLSYHQHELDQTEKRFMTVQYPLVEII